MLLSAPAAFGQTDPTPAPATTAPASAPSEPSPSTAATPENAQVNGAQAPDADHQVTCRTVASVESRLRRNRQRICGTRQQWEQMQDQNSREINNAGHVQGRTG